MRNGFRTKGTAKDDSPQRPQRQRAGLFRSRMKDETGNRLEAAARRRRIGVWLGCGLLAVAVGACVWMIAPAGGSATDERAAAEQARTGTAVSGEYGFRESGLPIVSQPVKLRAVVRKTVTHGDFTEMQTLRELERTTGIRLEWEAIAAEQYNERKKWMFLNGELPDLFFSGLTSSDVVRYGSQGLLLPLEGLIDRYAPNIKRVFEQYPEARKAATTPDGHIYALGFMEANDYMTYRNQLAINREWLDKLRLELPQTTDDLLHVLRAFKHGDPNGNGLADEIPLASLYSGINQNYRALFNAFGVLNPDGSQLAVQDGQVRYEPIQPAYKEAIRYMRQLYEEGLLDPETFTQDGRRFMAKGSSQEIVYGAFTAFLGNVELGSLERLKRYDFVPPLAGPNGDRTWRRQDNRITPNTFSITSANRYPEATMRLIDAMNEEDTAFQLWRGPFGSHIRRTGEGMITQNPLPAGEQVLEAWIGKAAPYNSLPLYFTKPMIGRYVPDETSSLRQAAYQMYKPFIVSEEETFPQYVYYTVDQLLQLRKLDADIQSYQSEMEAKWVIVGGIDEEWDGYIEELRRMGLARKLSIHQEAYDAYLAL